MTPADGNPVGRLKFVSAFMRHRSVLRPPTNVTLGNRLALNREVVVREERLDGKYLIHTCDQQLSTDGGGAGLSPAAPG